MGTGMTVAPYYMPDEVWRNLLGNSWERDGCRKRKRLDVTLWSHTTTCPGSLETRHLGNQVRPDCLGLLCVSCVLSPYVLSLRNLDYLFLLGKEDAKYL